MLRPGPTRFRLGYCRRRTRGKAVSQHILIVEDEPAIVDNVVYALEEQGFRTSVARLGAAGVELARQGHVDLVVLDIGLPDMSGIEVCEAIRRDADLPVIFLTARSEEADRVRGLELGADDYIVKPFSPRELAARVRAVLRRVGEAGKLEPARVRVDDDGKRVIFDGAALALTRYEFGILALLLERPGRVLSREQLLDAVWDDPLDATDRVVDTHVKTIRAKLDACGVRQLVRTHRGLGYSADPGRL